MIDSEQLKQNMVKAVEEIRATNPMAGSITNTVTIDFVANAQLAVGGSAAMVYLPDEGEALVAGGGAIYLNMGTLFPIYEQTIPRAAKAAHDAGKPWVLDPVGLGIGSLRTQWSTSSSSTSPPSCAATPPRSSRSPACGVLRGEAADLSRVRGVDTTDTVDAARDAAVALARYTGGAVVVSGEVDLITDGTTGGQVPRRQPAHVKDHRLRLLAGRRAGRVRLRHRSVLRRPVCGTAVYNVAGTRAAAVADAPASFKVAFIRRALPRDRPRHRQQPARARGRRKPCPSPQPMPE